MHRILIFSLVTLAGILVLLALAYGALAIKKTPEAIEYGASFNTLYARELGLDWRVVYDAMLEDLGVRKLRLAAHWTMVEPEDDVYNFEELDYQLAQAKEHDAEVILAVGRRLPRWPECHVPGWAKEHSWEEQKGEIREYITAVVERYKDEEHIAYWQVENEPYLTVFAYEQCGELDEDFLHEEIALVGELDPSRPTLVTDSGNLGTWFGAWQAGDAFGTSAYIYLWNPDVGPFKSFLPPSWYRVKERALALILGDKPTFLIELAAEPWLLEPIRETPLSLQLERMDIEKFNDIIEFAEKTRFERQYLWGIEWWYWLKEEHDDPRMWQRGKELFRNGE